MLHFIQIFFPLLFFYVLCKHAADAAPDFQICSCANACRITVQESENKSREDDQLLQRVAAQTFKRYRDLSVPLKPQDELLLHGGALQPPCGAPFTPNSLL